MGNGIPADLPGKGVQGKTSQRRLFSLQRCLFKCFRILRVGQSAEGFFPDSRVLILQGKDFQSLACRCVQRRLSRGIRKLFQS